MCHAQLQYHECQHTSVKWQYCAQSIYNIDPRLDVPCPDPTYSPLQTSKDKCPSQHCHFIPRGGRWTCCKCGHGANALPWCSGRQGTLLLLGVSNSYWPPKDHSGSRCSRKCRHARCQQCRANSSMIPHPILFRLLLCIGTPGLYLLDNERGYRYFDSRFGVIRRHINHWKS